jgi:pimeloyl-ACP methyl ester carboxylesterase
MANTIPYRATGSLASPLHKAFIREMLLAQDPRGYIANCKAIEKATPPDYKGVKCPVLIIAGEEDKSAPLEGCKYILGELATENKELEVLKGVGHWHCVEAGDQVVDLVGRFCDGL